MKGTHNRDWGETAGAGERGFGDAGMEAGDAQVGGRTSAEAGKYGTETGNAPVVIGPHAGAIAGAGAMTVFGLGAAGGDDGDRSRDRGQGGG